MAGNIVAILLRVYAKWLTASEQSALKRTEEAEPSPDKDRKSAPKR